MNKKIRQFFKMKINIENVADIDRMRVWQTLMHDRSFYYQYFNSVGSAERTYDFYWKTEGYGSSGLQADKDWDYPIKMDLE